MRRSLTSASLTFVLILSGCSIARVTPESPQLQGVVLTDAHREPSPLAPDSLTRLSLSMLASSAATFAEREGELPTSMEQVLRSLPIRSHPTFGRDAWGRPIVVSRSMNGSELLLLSLGADGLLGNGDDEFRIVVRTR